MAKTLKVKNFVGMDNVRQSEGDVSAPRVVLNADVTAEGRVLKRSGRSLVVDLPGAHSIWEGYGLMFCAAKGILYKIQDNVKEVVCSIGMDSPVSYVGAGNDIYISTMYWNGRYDVDANTIHDWGIDVPEQPVLLSTAGNLPAGIYGVCFTVLSDGKISGNGGVASIELTETAGISILNRPSGAVVWITDPNGWVFFMAGELDAVTGVPTSVEPMSTFLCSPPPYMQNLAYANGRIWGTVEKKLYGSEPYKLDLFKFNKVCFEFDRDLLMVAVVSTGLYVADDKATYFLGGTEPGEMKERKVGNGVPFGAVGYCDNLGELGKNVPVWVANDGIVAGSLDGSLVNLTQKKIRFKPGNKGASIFRMKGGDFQFLAAMKQGSSSNAAIGDDVTCEVVRNGRVV